MAALNSRIMALEQLHPKHKVLNSHLIDTYTDEELLDFLGLPDGATDEQLETIAQSKGVHHGKY